MAIAEVTIFTAVLLYVRRHNWPLTRATRRGAGEADALRQRVSWALAKEPSRRIDTLSRKSANAFYDPTGASNLKPIFCRPSSASLPYSVSISVASDGA